MVRLRSDYESCGRRRRHRDPTPRLWSVANRFLIAGRASVYRLQRLQQVRLCVVDQGATRQLRQLRNVSHKVKVVANEHSSWFTHTGRSHRPRKKHVNQHGGEVASDLRRKISPSRKPRVHFDQLVTLLALDKFKLEGAPPFQFLDDFFHALLESRIGNNDSTERFAVAGQHDLANSAGTKQAAPPVAKTDHIVFVAAATDCGLCDHRST